MQFDEIPGAPKKYRAGNNLDGIGRLRSGARRRFGKIHCPRIKQ
jgi:hypothetical protein